MKHFQSTLIFIPVVLISVALAGLLFYGAMKFCVVTKVELNKDFQVNVTKLYKFLDIQEGKFVWEYNPYKMRAKLATQTYLDEYDIKVKWPNSIYIYMRIRVPVARLVNADGSVGFIDKNALVFKESNYVGHLPLINANKKSDDDKKANQMYGRLVGILGDLKSRETNVYNAISQIDIVEYGKSNVHYIVSFTDTNKKVYLKNQLNSELLKEGLVTAMFLEGTGSSVNTAFYSGIGFVY